jgi:cold-inducible RNA-binding protein
LQTPPALSAALIKKDANSVNKKLYVGNLSYDTTSASLEAYFSQAGNVEEAVVVQDRDSGRSRGFGFVTMATEEAAAAAIEQFNGTNLDNRTIKVNEANPPRPREPRGGGFGRW